MSSYLVSLIRQHADIINALSGIASLINAFAGFLVMIATVWYVRLTGQLVRTTVEQNRLSSTLQAETRIARAASLREISKGIRIPFADWLGSHGQLYLDLKDSDIAALEAGSVEVGPKAISHASLAAYLLRLIRSTLDRDTAKLNSQSVRALLGKEEMNDAISRALHELETLEQECDRVVGG